MNWSWLVYGDCSLSCRYRLVEDETNTLIQRQKLPSPQRYKTNHKIDWMWVPYFIDSGALMTHSGPDGVAIFGKWRQFEICFVAHLMCYNTTREAVGVIKY